MKYDFNTVINRREDGSSKWGYMEDKIKLTDKKEIPTDIVPLSVADMELKNPPEITEGLKKYLDNHILGYTNPSKEYLNSVCRWMLEKHSWKVAPEQIITSPGVVTALYMAISAFCEKGDGVMIFSPVYYPFYSVIEQNDCEVTDCPLINENGRYYIDFELFEKLAAEKKNTMLLFCSPHNPVSRVWTKAELEKVGKICKKHNVRIISDEIHFDLIMPGYEHTIFANAVDFGDEIITCTAPSKTFNLASMQTSNIVVPNESDRKKLKAMMDKRAIFHQNALGFEACRLAYTECDAWMDEMLELIWGNYEFAKSYIEEHLPKIKVTPLEGTYLLWLDCREITTDKDKLELAMLNNYLFFDEGYIFGDGGIGFERINLACPKHVIEAAMHRLEKAISKIK